MMTIEQKLDEKLESLDQLDRELEMWLKNYQNGTTFPEHPEMNSNSSKLKTIKEIVTEMQEVAGHAEILSEVIEESEKW